MSAVKILIYMFILTMDKSPDTLHRFAAIEGRWTIVRAENHGKTAAPHTFGDYAEFVSSSKSPKQPSNAVAFIGELKPDHPRGRIDITTISVMLSPKPHIAGPADAAAKAKAAPLPAVPSLHPHNAIAIYQVSGNTMKILVTPMSNHDPQPRSQFTTTEKGNEFLLELRREAKH